MVSGPYHCGCLCSLIGFAAFGQLLRSVHRFVPLGLLVARLSCETAHDRIGDSGGARSHPTRLQVVATLSLQSRGLVGRRHRPVGKWKRRLKLGCRRYTRRRYWLTLWLPGLWRARGSNTVRPQSFISHPGYVFCYWVRNTICWLLYLF